ncbi:hypothetical protein SeMB42_g04976 [Synchytrium endobioticum]|uniref:Vasohibin n=1 Tax=Synchytrium endobioticum TaxID=286115 RepID=A0A507CV64_9FUNG|nr:hypothetical protein SeMB42_g04976 [Synchytrium endobioticum]
MSPSTIAASSRSLTASAPSLLSLVPTKINSSKDLLEWIHTQGRVAVKPPNIPTLRNRDKHEPNIVATIQKYLKKLEYNSLTPALTHITKSLPFCNLMREGQHLVRRGCLIKCLEAVVVSIYLTNRVAALDRIPLGFVSEENGATRRHIVLLVRMGAAWGCLGLSRKDELSGRAMGAFHDVVALIRDYHGAYTARRACEGKNISWIGSLDYALLVDAMTSTDVAIPETTRTPGSS